MVRMFCAVVPSAPVRAALGELDRPASPGVRWVPPEQWHVTLRFWSDGDPESAIAALDRATLPGAVARYGPVISRFGRDAVVLAVTGLDELAAAVRAATAEVPPPADPRPFRGHLTLARLRRDAACGIAGTPFEAIDPVETVRLVASELHPDGARHQVLAQWELGPPPVSEG